MVTSFARFGSVGIVATTGACSSSSTSPSDQTRVSSSWRRPLIRSAKMRPIEAPKSESRIGFGLIWSADSASWIGTALPVVSVSRSSSRLRSFWSAGLLVAGAVASSP